MTQKPFLRILLIISILWIAWLAMMLVHETGHVLGAIASGGTIRQVVWHPAVLSRTDVEPNPHPLIELWAGPIVGSLLPVIVASICLAFRLRIAYMLWVVAGFCLIANGAYIGIGAFDPVGDARELIVHGTSRWYHSRSSGLLLQAPACGSGIASAHTWVSARPPFPSTRTTLGRCSPSRCCLPRRLCDGQ